MTIQWTTQQDLGSVAELETISSTYPIVIEASASSRITSLKKIAGALPPGLSFSNGNITGTTEIVGNATEYRFTVRATANSEISDRTFTLNLQGQQVIDLRPDVQNSTVSGTTYFPDSAGRMELGQYVDGDYMWNANLQTFNRVPGRTIVYTVSEGSLPPGLTLDRSSGVISGFPERKVSILDETGNAVVSGFDTVGFATYAFDFDVTSDSTRYDFSVRVSDGYQTDTEKYSIYILSRDNKTADITTITIDTNFLTADVTNIGAPIITTITNNREYDLGTLIQGHRYFFKIEANDPDNQTFEFEMISGNLPDGLTMTNSSGWITGTVSSRTIKTQPYTFQVVAKKYNDSIMANVRSWPVTFTANVQGSVEDRVVWPSDADTIDLGTVYNGDISELAIVAATESGRDLSYQLYSNSYAKLPPGITLLADGSLSGRFSFNIDTNEQDVYGDINATPVDFEFTVQAYYRAIEPTTGELIDVTSDTKNYKITVASIFTDSVNRPFETLYARMMPSREQRAVYNSLIYNTEIVPESYLYRPADPWFGRNTDRRMTVLTGLDQSDISTLANIISNTDATISGMFYDKRLCFGDIKVAQATDDSNNPTYEIVYVDLIDPASTANTVVIDGRTVRPNSFDNWKQAITGTISQIDKGLTGRWMNTRQQDGTVPGFSYVLPLFYVIPGEGEEIAFRLNKRADELRAIEFTIDRFEFDRWVNDTSANAEPGLGNITVNTANVQNYFFTAVRSNIAFGTTSNVVVTANNRVVYGNPLVNFSNSGVSVDQQLYGTNSTNTVQLIGNISSIKSSTVLYIDSILSATTDYTFTNVYVAKTPDLTQNLHVGDTVYVDNNAIGTVLTVTNTTHATFTVDSNANISTLANINSRSWTYTSDRTYSTPISDDKYLKFRYKNNLR